MRINRWLSMMGVCSKKQADRLVQQQRVMVNQQPAYLGMQVYDNDSVMVDAQLITGQPAPLFILYHKPMGVVCTHDLRVANNIEAQLNIEQRVFAVGRLDKDSEGLMLLTNQGDIVNRLMHAKGQFRKTYRVWVEPAVNAVALQQMAAGIEMLGQTTLPCQITQIAPNEIEIVLVQGLNRQIRRMCQAVGLRVTRLQRTHILDLSLHNLPLNQWRELKQTEVQSLYQTLGMVHPNK